MVQPITMPKFGQMVEESSVSRWLKREGDVVHRGDILFEAETDKATMEVESFSEGTLLKIVVPEGNMVPVMSVVAYIGDPGEAIPVLESSGPDPSPPPAEPVKASSEPGPAATAAGGATAERRAVSPRAARLAREAGIDVSQIAGSGPGGRVVESDVERAIAERPETLSGIRQVIARRVSESYRTAPHFFTTQSVDMTELEGLRAQLKTKGRTFSVNDFVLRAVVLALMEHPLVNSATDGVHLRRHSHVDLGLAVATGHGLVVPVIRQAELLSLDQTRDAAAELTERARAGKLLPDEMTGSTFTVSNMGMLDVENFTAIINPGEGAILAVSSVRKEPAVLNDQVAIRSKMKITLSADHRLIDGADAVQFVNAVRDKLEEIELWRGLIS